MYSHASTQVAQTTNDFLAVFFFACMFLCLLVRLQCVNTKEEKLKDNCNKKKGSHPKN